MPSITDIKRSRRSSDHFRIYLDEEYAFELNSLDLSTSGLRIGQTLSEAEVEEHQKVSEFKGVYNLALRFLGVRQRSTREMSDYLIRKGCSKEQAPLVLEHLETEKLLDDTAFCANWIANRQSLRPRSKRRLEQELMAKGIAREVIAGALQEIDGEDEVEMLVQVAERKRKLPQYQDPKKLIGYLMRQGYTYEVIKRALERLE